MKYLLFTCFLFTLSCTPSTPSHKSSPTSTGDTSPLHRIVGEGKAVVGIDNILFEANFDGGRLHGVNKIAPDTYRIFSAPYSVPVNKSPSFAFTISSPVDRTIYLEFDYMSPYTHRYIPKISLDGSTWHPADSADLTSTGGKSLLKIQLNQSKLWVAAQEIITSDDMIQWALAQTRSHPFLDMERVAETPRKNPLLALNSLTEGVANSIVLIARQHPPEVPGGYFGFKSFFSTLMASTDLAKAFRSKFNIYTFPLANPDGADMGNWRHNSNGKDLNRDWIDFSQPETRIIRDYINKAASDGKKIVYGIDFHTSYSGPYFLIYTDDSYTQLGHNMTDIWIHNIEENSNQKVGPRKRSQELPYAYNWFYRTFGSEAVTFEDGDEIDRSEIDQRARIYATHFMKTLINQIK